MVLPKAFFKHLHINGIAVGSRSMQEDYIKATECNALIPEISHEFALDELSEAFKVQEQGGHFGKIVVHI